MAEIKLEQLSDVYKDVSSIIGLENTLLLYNAFKGQQISFPIHLISRDYVKMQIIAEYDGSNVKEISKKYGYSERWVRELVKKSIK